MAEARTTTILRPKFRVWNVARLAIVIVMIPAVAHGVWAWQADRSLRQRIEALRARGERVLPDDFKSKEVLSRYDNAARDLRAAAAIADDDTDEAAAVSWVSTTRPVDPRAWPYLVRARAWSEPAVRRIAAAQSKPTCDWEHRIQSPAMDLLLPELNGLDSLRNVLTAAALVEHREGRDDQVVRRFCQMLFLGDTCARTPAIVAHNVAIGASDAANLGIEELAPDLRIGAGEGMASVVDVRKLIAALLDEASMQSGFETALHSQRMCDTDRFTWMGRNPKENAVMRYFARPWFDTMARATLGRSTAIIDALRGAADWPTASARLEALPPMSKGPLTRDAHDPFDVMRDTAKNHFFTLADRRLAATALAIRLYQLDHAGARPLRLDELVPAYLPKVPLDAMAAGGQTIKYLPRADHPVLYSAGLNGVDDSGSEAPMPNEYGEINEWWRLDRVFYLTAHRREYIYIARPHREGMAMIYPYERIPPWERDARATAAAAAAATQPASHPTSR